MDDLLQRQDETIFEGNVVVKSSEYGKGDFKR